MQVFEEKGKPQYPGKTSQSREESQQTPPTYDTKSGNRTRATLVGGKCSHHYATTALYCFLFQGYVKPNAKETFISYTDMSLSKSVADVVTYVVTSGHDSVRNVLLDVVSTPKSWRINVSFINVVFLWN